jgi:putative salt-induced outer membrane protein YdiY
MRQPITFASMLAAALLTGRATAQEAQPTETQPPPPPPNPLPVPTPPPQPGESKLDLKPEPLSFFSGWKGGVEVGINGSEGNSENFNVHAGLNAERKTEEYVTKASFIYLRSSTDGVVSKNRAELDLRNDWILAKGSPWRVFAQAAAEYDDFQDWQYRLTALAGIGYAFIDNDHTTLVGRAGFGVRDDLLGSDNRIHPEAMVGLDWTHKFSQRQSILFTAEIYDDLLDMSEWRAKLKAEWSLVLDPETKLSVKIGAEDRYQSDPGPGKKNNDLDYYALLVWSF